MNTQTGEIHGIQSTLSVEQIKDIFEDVNNSIHEFKSTRVIAEVCNGSTVYYYEDKDEPPEGKNYEEDGLVKVKAVGDRMTLMYGESEEFNAAVRPEFALSIPERDFAYGLIPRDHNRENEESYIMTLGDHAEEPWSEFKDRLSVEPSFIRGRYVKEGEALVRNRKNPECTIHLDGNKIYIKDGKMSVICDSREILDRAYSNLKEDNDWPPEIKLYKKKETGYLSIDDGLEIEKREEELSQKVVFNDIHISDSSKVSFVNLTGDKYVLIGYSENSFNEAEKVMNQFKNMDEVHFDLEKDEGKSVDYTVYEN
mgnify:CR=1 FL=1